MDDDDIGMVELGDNLPFSKEVLTKQRVRYQGR